MYSNLLKWECSDGTGTGTGTLYVARRGSQIVACSLAKSETATMGNPAEIYSANQWRRVTACDRFSHDQPRSHKQSRLSMATKNVFAIWSCPSPRSRTKIHFLLPLVAKRGTAQGRHSRGAEILSSTARKNGINKHSKKAGTAKGRAQQRHSEQRRSRHLII